MPYHKHTVTNEISMIKKAISNHFESDVYAGVLLMETSRLVLLGHGCWRIGEDESCTSFECIGALGNRRATEPHLLHDCKKVMAVFLWAARVPANTPHPGLFTSKHSSSLPASVTATSSPFLFLLFSSCTPYLRPTSQHISQVVLATEGAAQSDSSPVHLRWELLYQPIFKGLF